MRSLFLCFRPTALVAVLASPLSPQRVWAQDANTLPPAPRAGAHMRHIETSVSVGAFAQLTATRISDTSNNFVTESMRPSAGVMASFRQSFFPWLGYSVNVGYAAPTYRYTAPSLFTATPATVETFVPAHMYETSFSYIAERHVTRRFSVFGEAGGGAIGFAAKKPAGFFQRRSNAFMPEGIAGFGVDYRLAHGLGVRGEYRGLFLKYPYPDYSDSIRLNTIMSAPTLSLTYNFRKWDSP